MTNTKTLSVFSVGEPIDKGGTYHHKNESPNLVVQYRTVMVLFHVGSKRKQSFVILCRPTVHEIHVCPNIQASNYILAFVHHHAVGDRIGELQQTRVFECLPLHVPDQIGSQEEIF